MRPIKFLGRKPYESLNGLRYFGVNKKDPPKLSQRSRRDFAILTLGTVAAGTYLYCSKSIEEEARESIDRLMGSRAKRHPGLRNHTCLDPPPPVQRFLNRIKLPGTPNGERPETICVVQQSGEFFASHEWYPFKSFLLVSGSFEDPRFLWHAKTKIYGMPQHILQKLMQGQGTIITKAWGKIPTVQLQEEEPYVLFWLGMLPLCPQALLQIPADSTRLEWTVHDLYTARARLVSSNPEEDEYQIQFDFDPISNLLQSITVTADSLEKPWKSYYSDYQSLGQNLLMPSRIVIGKMAEDGDCRLHLKIQNEAVAIP